MKHEPPEISTEQLTRYLDGFADERLQQDCETILAHSSTVIDPPLESKDSLIEALQQPHAGADFDSQELASLTKTVEQKLIVQRQMDASEVCKHLGPPQDPNDIGSVGRFRLVEFLAKGGMGIVFRAIDPELERTVCIKLLNPRFEFQEEAKARFARESREMACLLSERIVPVLEVGEQQGLPFFVMPMLQGMTLRKMLEQQHQLDAKTALRLTRQTAEGLQCAHQRGLLHRDIKPDNLWITETGDIKILDFGLAHIDDSTAPITRSGTVIGTPSYMSPEQVTGKPLDPRSDLFSLGVVLVEMLTGASPFERPNLFSTLMSVAGDTFEVETIDPNHQIAPGLRALLSRLLTKQPDQRIESAEVLIDEIRVLEANPQAKLPETASQSNGSRWVRMILSGLTGAAACLAILTLYFANDKGTLVVTTSDPQVEISIANESVKVFDPITKRRFEIKIGELPLPSGVYQLEATEGTGDLVFSSQSIAIRRGEETIVQVDLKPSPGPSPSVASDDLASKTNVTKADATIVDPSFDPVTRERFPIILKFLDALPLTEFKNGALSAFGAVRKPYPLPHFDNWSVEPTVDSLSSWQANSDGTYFSHRADDGYVRIFGPDGSLKHMLPSQGRIADTQWDTRIPNLFAFVSYIPVEEGGGVANAKITIYVWKLNGVDGRESAELLYRIPTSAAQFTWDGGYRIAYFRDKKLHFFRLDTGKSVEVPIEATGRLGARAISNDGQFIALRGRAGEQSAVNIWNLHTGQFHYAIIGSSRGYWSDKENRFALQPWSNEKVHYEIWDVEAKQLAQSIELPYADERGEKKSPRGHKLDRSLKRLAWVNHKGTLFIRNIENNREGRADLTTLFDETKRNFIRLSWTVDDNLAISTRGKIAKWTQGSSMVDGAIEHFSPKSVAYEVLDQTDFSLNLINFNKSNRGIIQWRSQRNNSTTALQEAKSIFDLNHLQWIEVASPDFASNELVSMSPNGEYIAILPNNRQSGRAGWQVVSLVDNQISTVNRPIQDQSRNRTSGGRWLWSQDSRFIAFTSTARNSLARTNRSQTLYSTWLIYDIQNDQIVESEKLLIRRGKSMTAASWQHLFLFAVDSDVADSENGSGNVDIVVYDPAKNGVIHRFDDGYSSVTSIRRFGDKLIVEAIKKDQTESSKFTLSMDSAPNGAAEFHLQELNYVQPNSKTLLSNDSQWAGVIVSDVEVESTMRSSNRTVEYLKHVGPDRIKVAKWNDLIDKALPDQFLLDRLTANKRDLVFFAEWHAKENVFCWQVDNRVSFFDPATQSLLESPDELSTINNMPFGWLAVSGRRLLALDPFGKYVGQIRFWKKPSGPSPGEARWIFSDGSLLDGDNGQGLSIVYVKNDQVITRPYIDVNNTEVALPVTKVNPVLGAVSDSR